MLTYCRLCASVVEQKAALSGEEQERKITTYEEAMNKIKDATGVSDIREVVERFLSQGDTHKHLEQLKGSNEKMLVRLKEEKVKGRTNFVLVQMVQKGKLTLLSPFRLCMSSKDKKASARTTDLFCNSKLVILPFDLVLKCCTPE